MSSLKKAENFNKKLKKEKALKLDIYKEVIKYLLENNTSILAIQKYLLEKEKIQVSYSNLYTYIKKIFISNDKKVDSNINSKALFQKSDYEKIEDYCEQLKNDFIPRSEHFKYQTIESVINYFVKKSQEPRIPTLEAKSKNDDSLVANKNIKTYTLGTKVSKKMNIDCD
jgi:IS30 family transposase